MGQERLQGSLLRFADFELDRERGELRRQGIPQRMEKIPLELLGLLIEQADRLVTREQIAERLWGEISVDTEGGINTAIRKVRQALEDDPAAPRFVQTVLGRGYRFIAPVSGDVVVPEALAPSISPPVSSRARHAWLIAGMAVVLGLLAVLLWRARSRGQADGKMMLAVLPFENMSGDPQQDYFSEGLTEELIAQLGRLQPSRLGVIARTSAMLYKGQRKSIAEVGRELGVDYVVEGSARQMGGRVRITAQLIQVRDQTHLWARNFDRESHEVLAVQDEVARGIAEEVRLVLAPESLAWLERSRSVDPEAHRLYLVGRYHWNKRTPEGFAKAIQSFDAALERDPTFARAWAGLADTYGLMGVTGYDVRPPRDVMPKARAAALRALEIDPGLAEAQASLAWVRFVHDWDWKQAELGFQQAIRSNEGYATAHQWYSNFLCAQGRYPEALAQVQQALAHDPLSLIISDEAAWPHYYARRYDQAIQQYRRTLELDPAFGKARWELGLAYSAQQRYVEAIAEYERLAAQDGRSPLALAFVANAMGRAGRHAQARALITELQGIAAKRYVPAFYPAIIYAGLGDNRGAMDFLEEAFEERSDYLLYLRVDPIFDTLRGDSRFEALARRLDSGPAEAP